MKRVALYLRVSDKKQIEGTSLDTQESICRSYCSKCNLKVVDIVSDKGISAHEIKTSNAQRVLELLDYCKKTTPGLMF